MPRITKNKRKSNKKVKTNRKQKKEIVSFIVVKKTRKTRKTQKGGTEQQELAKEISTLLGKYAKTNRNVWVVTKNLADKTIIESIKKNIKNPNTDTKTIFGKDYEIVTGKMEEKHINDINNKRPKSGDVKYNRYIPTDNPSPEDVEAFIKTGIAPASEEKKKADAEKKKADAEKKAKAEAEAAEQKLIKSLRDADPKTEDALTKWKDENKSAMEALTKKDLFEALLVTFEPDISNSSLPQHGPATKEQTLIDSLKTANPTTQDQLNTWASSNGLPANRNPFDENKFIVDENSALFAEIQKIKTSDTWVPPSAYDGGKRKSKKSKKTNKVRKHRGIVQTGGSAGRLRKGYKYTGRRLKNGQAEIKKVKQTRK